MEKSYCPTCGETSQDRKFVQCVNNPFLYEERCTVCGSFIAYWRSKLEREVEHDDKDIAGGSHNQNLEDRVSQWYRKRARI